MIAWRSACSRVGGRCVPESLVVQIRRPESRSPLTPILSVAVHPVPGSGVLGQTHRSNSYRVMRAETAHLE